MHTKRSMNRQLLWTNRRIDAYPVARATVVMILFAAWAGTAAFGQSVSSIVISGTSIIEGDSGTTLAIFNLDISPANEAEIELEHATSDGTAIAGLDYVATSGPLTIPANLESFTIQVEVLGDVLFEVDQTFTLTISNPSSNALISVGTAVATILDDEEFGQSVVLLSDNFEGSTVLTDWDLTGDWRVKENSACFPNDLGFFSPTNALAFDFGSDCSYRNNRSGFATLRNDVDIPIIHPSARLEWWDFVGAEVGADFYFIQVSTDGGVTWPDEIFRESISEEFWDRESVDLSQFVGQSIRIRFGFTSDASITNFGWYIDDVQIVGEGLAEGVSAVAVSDTSIIEGDSGTTMATFNLEISPANAVEIELEHATFNGTAIAGLDYVATSGPLTIPANQESFTIEVEVFGDAFFEIDETFSLTVSNASSNGFISIGTAVATILDDEALVCLEIAGTATVEDWEPRPSASPWSTSGLWHLQENSACIDGQDGFSSATRAMVFNNGEGAGACTYFSEAGSSGALTMTGAFDIPDNALAARLSFSHYLEVMYDGSGDGLAPEARVEVSDDLFTGNIVTVFTFKPDTTSSDPIVIPWNEAVADLGDFIGKQVSVRFVFEQLGSENPHTAAGWFVDDISVCFAPLPAGVSRVIVDPASGTEGNGGTNLLRFPVRVGETTTEEIVVAFETVALEGELAATEDLDFISTASQLTIPAGTLATDPMDPPPFTIDVLLLGDDLPEAGDEIFTLRLSNVTPNAFLVNQEVTGTIEDDDIPAEFIITYQENFTGIPIELLEDVGTVTLDVTLDTARSVAIDATYFTQDGTALSGLGLDFLETSGSLHFPANTTAGSLELTILQDEFAEDPINPTAPDPNIEARGALESFKLEIKTTSAFANGRTKVIEIKDDDLTSPGQPRAMIIEDASFVEGSCSDISAEESCGSLGQIVFHVKALAGAIMGENIQIDYSTQDVTAIAGEDYEATSGTLLFTAVTASVNEEMLTVSVNVFADRTIEGDETFLLKLSSPRGPVVVVENSGIGTIKDDDYTNMTFGASGTVVSIRPLDDDTISTPLLGIGPVNFTANDFKGFDFGLLYGWDAPDDILKSIDLVDGSVTPIATININPEDWTGLAWDHTNGLFYATRTDGEIHTVDLGLGTTIQVGTSARNLSAVAVHPTSGRIYAIDVIVDTSAELIYTVPGDWSWTSVGIMPNVTPKDVNNSPFWDMDFDDTTAKLYVNGFVFDPGGDKWITFEVDVNDATTTTSFADPTISPLAIATRPTPSSVRWTSDLNFASESPNGINIITDSTTLPETADVGSVISGVGDVNGDGFEDFVITAQNADAGSFTGAGKAYLFYGGKGVASRLSELALSDVTLQDSLLTAANGMTITGSVANEHLGVSVSGVGDINNDGLGDFVIGFIETDAENNSEDEIGGAYLIFGNALFPAEVSVADVGDVGLGAEVSGVKIVGAAAGDSTGISISGAGDFNGDGIPDMIIGAPGHDPINPDTTSAMPDAGAVYVIFGSEFGIGTSGVLNLGSILPPVGIRIYGNATADELGSALSGVGDINGDGIDDIALAALGKGSAYAFFGHVGYQESDAPNPIHLARLDIAVSGPAATSLKFTSVLPGENDLGTTYIQVRLNTQDPEVGKIPGLQFDGQGGGFGTALTGLGDVNGDSIDDFAISAPSFDGSGDATEAHWGRIYLAFGSDSLDTSIPAQDIGTAVPGLLITGLDNGDLPGSVLGAGSDINGDGYMDVLIGAQGAARGQFSGEAYVVFGGSGLGGRLSLRDLADSDPKAQAGLYLYNTDADSDLNGGFDFAQALSPVGDFNDDSIADFVIGRNKGALIINGTAQGTSAKYLNRIPTGRGFLADIPLEGADLGETVTRGVGLIGNGRSTKPASRVTISFKGGGFGQDLAGPSTQSATVFRFAAPDIAVGDGTAEDDARWIPSGVHWLLSTNRHEFTKSVIEFQYRPEEVAGFDVQDVAMFFAKPNQTLSENTVWSALPFTHDPDRRVFTVSRNHERENAQIDFNGYYVLVKADLLTVLGQVIPSVGVLTENVFEFGPEIVPSELAFWHIRDKKLYAVKEGSVTLRWKNKEGEVVSVVEGLNIWPTDSSLFQIHVANTPGIILNPEDEALEFPFSRLTTRDDVVIVNTAETPLRLEEQVTSEHIFSATLTPNEDVSDRNGVDDPTLTGRSIILLSTNADAGRGDVYFQFITTVKWNNPDFLLDGDGSGIPWPVGTIIGQQTDPNFARHHDERAGAPFIFFTDAAYVPESSRYQGFYVRDERRGSIVPVNTGSSGSAELVLNFYQRGARLIDAKTGNPARDPITRESITTFDWPHISSKYNVMWPTNAPEIIVARQDGSREIDPAIFGTELDIYFENQPGTTGFNPNEEHAFLAPFGTGVAVFALRNDLNADEGHSEPFALMSYFDPNDLNIDGDPRAKIQIFQVLTEKAPFFFHEWVGFEGNADPYEGDVAALILPLYPLSLFTISPDNTSPELPLPTDTPAQARAKKIFKDRNNSLWAKSAGTIVSNFYYPALDSFFFPGRYIAKHLAVGRDILGGRDVPLLDGGFDSGRILPVDVTFTVNWPDIASVPTMRIADILIGPKLGLPAINGQCSVDFIFEESPNSVKLIDPVQARVVDANLDDIIGTLSTTFRNGELVFADLPPALSFRLSYDQFNRRLKFKGLLIDPVLGEDYVLLNVLTLDDYDTVRSLSTNTLWTDAVDDLFIVAGDTFDIADSSVDPFDVLAMTTGDSQGTGWVVLAMQNSVNCAPLPVSLEVIRINPELTPGNVAVVKPGCVFDERLTLMQTIDYGGHPENYDFEWMTIPDDGGTIPDLPDLLDPTDLWVTPNLLTPTSGRGVNTIAIEGPGLLTLTDNWFAVRYREAVNPALPWHNEWSDWTPPQLAPGWIKRVVGQINPFTQRAGGGGIAGAEASFASFGESRANSIVSMISQAGPRFVGSVPLNCDILDDFGLIEIYETVLNRGADLSINALSPLNHPGVNTALLLVASRIHDLYMLLGNEANADAQDPTIGFGTSDGTFGTMSTSIHAFMNQTSSLLEEELALLRGRDATFAPSLQTVPIHNRLVWNFTTDFTGGEVAYALNYNIRDDVEEGDGIISELDAKRLYPQGHGDAWGHYLKSQKTYYSLFNHPFYAWSNRSEAVLVGGQPVTVDFIDERKFAQGAAAKARTGQEIASLTYRSQYIEDPSKNWFGYKDADKDRAWGFSEWASRAGQGAYIDWVVGNALIRAVDPIPDHQGIQRIDRTTVLELPEIASAYRSIEATSDMADLGHNPLGLGSNVIPFDISPTLIDEGQTHFEQIFTRAVTALSNTQTVFDLATNSTQLLRQQADSIEAFQRGVLERELDINARLIEIFGYPYPEDIGPGGTYATGYNGPDLFHFMYTEDTPFRRDGLLDEIFFEGPSSVLEGATAADADIPSLLDSQLADFLIARGITIGDGEDIQIQVQVRNFEMSDLLITFDGIAGTGLPTDLTTVQYNFSTSGGRFGLDKPDGWGERRALGEIQLASGELNQQLAKFLIATENYNGLMAEISNQVDIIVMVSGVQTDRITFLVGRRNEKITLQSIIFGLQVTKLALNTASSAAEKFGEAVAKAVPTVTGVIAGLAAGAIIDPLAPIRGLIETISKFVAFGLTFLANAAEVAIIGLGQADDILGEQLNIDMTENDFEETELREIQALTGLLGSELTRRIEMHSQYDAVIQASAAFKRALAEGLRLVDRRALFRRQTTADIQEQRYKDMAFRIFRNESLQKYRAQYDMAARYTYLAAKAYDYETTLLSSDPLAGQNFLTDIVRARQLGAIVDGKPLTGVGLADSLAVMGRNFEVLIGQLGFNNPQVETNRFSLRRELFRVLPGEEGNANWREILSQDYFTNGVGTVSNLWDVAEFRQFCVPPAGFGAVEPGIVIPFSSMIEEGMNFFGKPAGGLDSSYDSTQFATKIRSVGVWFSNYDFLNLSNTPRVYLVPAGTDVLRSPTGFTGRIRLFNVLDQVLPVPFPIGATDVESPSWIPSLDSVAGRFVPIRRFGRFRAFHDSGEFTEDEVHRDSRLVGRSVWNTNWILIIPASTLGAARETPVDGGDERLRRLIEGPLVAGERTGNGISDIKLFFETYAFPRLKKAAQ